MLHFQNGRFYTHGVSFAIPDGFFLETEPEFVHQYGFSAWTSDRSFFVEWDIEENCIGTEKELNHLFLESLNVKQLSRIQPITVNGLLGHQIFYNKWNKCYFEVRLSLKDGAEFVFLVSRVGEKNIFLELSSDLQMALHLIKPDFCLEVN
jgi:hypothetical protein